MPSFGVGTRIAGPAARCRPRFPGTTRVDCRDPREYGRRDRAVAPQGGSKASPQEIGARFVEAFNAHDESRIRELNAENTRFEAPGDVKIEGGEAATQYAMAWLRAFP